jgi:hypothetical protein
MIQQATIVVESWPPLEKKDSAKNAPSVAVAVWQPGPRPAGVCETSLYFRCGPCRILLSAEDPPNQCPGCGRPGLLLDAPDGAEVHIVTGVELLPDPPSGRARTKRSPVANPQR